MSLTINSKAYGSPQRFDGPALTYFGPGKSVSKKDDVRLTATAPKPTATFSGIGRTSAKMTRTLDLTGALTPQGDAIIDVQVSVPVGFTASDVETMCDDIGAWVASSAFKAHVKAQQTGF